jgi:hypothetical protein
MDTDMHLLDGKRKKATASNVHITNYMQLKIVVHPRQTIESVTYLTSPAPA